MIDRHADNIIQTNYFKQGVPWLNFMVIALAAQ